jgi:DNA-binding transcriptional regulator/RsmH inhibitor MraZ
MPMQIPTIRFISLALMVLFVALSPCAQQPEPKRLFPVEKESKFGFIDRAGRVVIPLQFDDARDFHEGLALVKRGEKKLFIDTSGRVVIEAKYDIVHDFSEGLAAVNIGERRNGIGLIANPGEWGYIDKTGKLVIPMKFTHAEDFSEGLAAVNLGDSDHGAFIDHTGKTIFEVPLDVTVGFHEGLAGVLLRGTVAYYDRTGRKIPISTAYGPKSSSFSEGLLPIEVKDKWGYVDRAGKIVIEPKFEDGESFREGLAPVKVRGEVVWCPPDSSGNRSGSSMMWGYIDKTGRIVIPQVFNYAEPFSEGLAAVSKCDEAYFIDKTGKQVISGKFRETSSFSGGLARVSVLVNGALLDAYVDKTGRIVWGPAK